MRYSSQGGNSDEGSQLNALGETRRVAGGSDPATASSERPELVLSLAAKSFHAWQRGLVLAAAFEGPRAWRARQLEPATPRQPRPVRRSVKRARSVRREAQPQKRSAPLNRGSRFSPRASIAIAVRGPSGMAPLTISASARLASTRASCVLANKALVVRREALAVANVEIEPRHPAPLRSKQLSVNHRAKTLSTGRAHSNPGSADALHSVPTTPQALTELGRGRLRRASCRAASWEGS